MIFLSLRAVHLMFMGTWFGVSLFAAGDMRRTLATPPDAATLALLSDRMRRTGRMAGISGIITWLSGLALIVYLGGMASVPWPIHLALTLALVMIGIGIGGIARTWNRIAEALEGGASVDDVRPLMKRISALSGVFHLLWLICFLLMVFRYMIAGPAGS